MRNIVTIEAIFVQISVLRWKAIEGCNCWFAYVVWVWFDSLVGLNINISAESIALASKTTFFMTCERRQILY